MVIASDASESGMGVCRTATLTQLGHQALQDRMAPPVYAGDAVVLVEVFSGIGGFRQALRHLNVLPAAYYTSEIDPNARRVTRAAWPDNQDIGPVEGLTGEILE